MSTSVSKPTAREFLRVLVADWASLVSGGLSVPFAYFALFANNSWNRVAYAGLALLGLLFASFRIWKRERLAHVHHTHALSSRDSSRHQSQSVGNSGNITQQVFVGPERDLKPITNVQEEEEPPRLDFVQPEFTFLNESEFHVWHEVDAPMPVNNALIAQFKNAPKGIGHQTSKAGSVVATLVFVGRGNPRELHVAHGTWLREYTHFVTFKSGQTHKLIIALNAVRIKRNSTCFVTLSNPRASNPFAPRFRPGYTIHPLEALDLPGPAGQVRITLVDGSGITVFDGGFDYSVSDDEMSLTPLRGAEPSKGHL